MNREYIPSIRSTFCLTKKDLNDFDREKVTYRLSITPTQTGSPEMSKGKMICEQNIQHISKELVGLTILPASAPPYEMMKHAFWSIDLPKMESWSLERPLRQLEQILHGKEAEIVAVCTEYNLRADLFLQVFAEARNLPELTFSSESVSFWSSLGASIALDFCLD